MCLPANNDMLQIVQGHRIDMKACGSKTKPKKTQPKNRLGFPKTSHKLGFQVQPEHQLVSATAATNSALVHTHATKVLYSRATTMAFSPSHDIGCFNSNTRGASGHVRFRHEHVSACSVSETMGLQAFQFRRQPKYVVFLNLAASVLLESDTVETSTNFPRVLK